MDTLIRNVLAGLAAVSAIAALVLQSGPDGASLFAGLLAGLFACGAVIAATPRWGVLSTAALAFGANAYLFSRKLDIASGPSACNISDVLNCDVVNTSAASEMFGLPITLFGMGLYLGLALTALYRAESTPRFFQVTGLFAIASLVYSAYLAWESSKLGVFCVVCATIYVANGLLLWAALKGLAGEGRKLLDELGGAPLSTSFLTVAGTFLVVVVVGAGTWQQRTSIPGPSLATGGDPAAVAEGLALLYASPQGPVTLDGTEPVLGRPDAPYVVVEWADFACPHCARAAEELSQLVREYPVQVRFKSFPLSSTCNPSLQFDGGNERCRAALAAECAHQQDRFYDLAHLIFKNQAYLSDADLTFMANQVGLDMDRWQACMADPASMEGVVADALAGARAGVRGTPAIFLRGTHGEEFIEVAHGAAGVMRLIEAAESGTSLPPPTARGLHDGHGH